MDCRSFGRLLRKSSIIGGRCGNGERDPALFAARPRVPEGPRRPFPAPRPVHTAEAVALLARWVSLPLAHSTNATDVETAGDAGHPASRAPTELDQIPAMS